MRTEEQWQSILNAQKDIISQLTFKNEMIEAELAERLDWNKACIESAGIASAEIAKQQAEIDRLREHLRFALMIHKLNFGSDFRKAAANYGEELRKAEQALKEGE